MGKEVVVTQDPKRIRPEKSEVERLLCDNTKACEIMDWKPEVTLDKGLELTIDWIEKNSDRFKRTDKYTV
jgi:dTDP-glucose 4,6-dehydratase